MDKIEVDSVVVRIVGDGDGAGKQQKPAMENERRG